MNLLAQIDIDAENPQSMEIMDLNGKPLTENEAEKPIINLYGLDNESLRAKAREIADDDEERNAKVIALAITSWQNIKNEHGVDIECNFDNALTLIKRYPVVYSQLDTFIANRANFLKKS